MEENGLRPSWHLNAFLLTFKEAITHQITLIRGPIE
jgi:hypothetical protein